MAEESKTTAIEIQNVTGSVTNAVSELSQTSNRLLSFVSTEVDADYEKMYEVAESYNADAAYVDDLVSEFSATSEELLASIQEVLRAIDNVAMASSEGAGGTTDIAIKIADINENSNLISNYSNQSKADADKLKVAVSKFKLD